MASIDDVAGRVLDVYFDVFPIAATLLAVAGHDDRLPGVTVADDARADADLAAIEADGRRLAGTADPDGAVTLAVVTRHATSLRRELAAAYPAWCVADDDASPVPQALNLLPLVGIASTAHAEGYLARLAALPAWLDAVADRHLAGIAEGRPPVRRLAAALVTRLDRNLAAAADDPLARPTPAPDAEVDAGAFGAARDGLLADVVRPALARYRRAVAEHVAPHGRDDDHVGLCWLPGGDATYADLVAVHTTTDATPDDLHRLGLDIVDRLRAEYAEIGAAAFGTGDVEAVWRRLTSDPAMFFAGPDEVLDVATRTVARAEAAAPGWFGRRPSAPCAVEPVPPADAPGAPAAYYIPPALDGSRPGTYFANTHRADERDRYSAESIAFHEATPGHHFQLAIAQQLADLPLVRRLLSFNAYAEGWGLYAERLADEMGLYSDPIARLGMLAGDSVRAARLVVDTGIHASGWTRRQVVDYLTANTLMPAVEVESETDRYIANPGQALGYMVGRLHIQGLRADAERRLGPAFDLAGFHDAVLAHGSLPLDVLTTVVDRWVAAAA